MRKVKKHEGTIDDMPEFSKIFKEEFDKLPTKVINHTTDMLIYIGHSELNIKEDPNRHARLFE